MEMQKIVNLLNSSENDFPKFSIKKWHIIDCEIKGSYLHHNPLNFLTSSLESSLCDYFDAYILVTGDITATRGNTNTKVAFKNCAPFGKCRTEIIATSVDEADFINIAMSRCNLIEYSHNYSDTSGNLWHFTRDEIATNANVCNANSSSFKYKSSLIGYVLADGANGNKVKNIIKILK